MLRHGNLGLGLILLLEISDDIRAVLRALYVIEHFSPWNESARIAQPAIQRRLILTEGDNFAQPHTKLFGHPQREPSESHVE